MARIDEIAFAIAAECNRKKQKLQVRKKEKKRGGGNKINNLLVNCGRARTGQYIKAFGAI